MPITEEGRLVVGNLDEFGRLVVTPMDEFGRLVYPSVTSTTVTISGASVLVKKGTLYVETRIEERSIAEFVVIDEPGTASYEQGEPVSIYDIVGSRIFSGFVSVPDQITMAPSGGLYHHIMCMDNHYLADKRRVAESYASQTCGFIVDDIYDKYLANEGITIGAIEAGPTLTEAVFNYVTVTDAYDAIAEKAGKIWYIDSSKCLYFTDRTTLPAAWNATGDDMIKGTSRLSGGNSMYRNRQYVRGGRDITGPQVETFTGDGITVSFTVGYPINSEPTVTVGGVPQLMGIKGIDDTMMCYWSKGDSTIVFDPLAIPAPMAAIVVTYIGQYDILVLVTDEGEILAQKSIEGGSTTGYVDDVADETKLDDRDAMFESGQAKLDKYGVGGKTLRYHTTRTGLKAGRLQTVTYAPYGLAAEDMLIESVVYRGLVSEMVHEIVAVQGPEHGSWASYFKKLGSQKDEIMDRLNVGSDQILIILVTREETWEWSETVSTTVYACPVVALDLYPSAGAVTLLTCTLDMPTANLTDFPVTIKLESSAGKSGEDVTQVFDRLGANWNRLWAIDATTGNSLNIEVVEWDEVAETAELHIKVPTVNSLANTVIYLSASMGNSVNPDIGVVGSTAGQGVWDADFVRVDHLSDNPNTSTTQDSTSIGIAGNKKGANEPIEVAGVSGYAQDFDGADDYIDVAHHASQLLTVAATLEAFIKPDSLGETSYGRVIDKTAGGACQQGYWFMTGTGNKMWARINSGAHITSATNSVIPADGNWYHTVCTWNAAGLITHYVNGAASGVPGVSAAAVGIITVNNLRVGNRATATDRTFEGLIDELRISKIIRPTAWIAATNDTIRDDFITYAVSNPDAVYPC